MEIPLNPGVENCRLRRPPPAPDQLPLAEVPSAEKSEEPDQPPAQIASSSRRGSRGAGSGFGGRARKPKPAPLLEDGRLMLVANESQETIGIFDEVTGTGSPGRGPEGLRDPSPGRESLACDGREQRRRRWKCPAELLTMDPEFQRPQVCAHGSETQSLAEHPPCGQAHFCFRGAGRQAPGVCRGFLRNCSLKSRRAAVLAFHIYAGRLEDSVSVRAVKQYRRGRRQFIQRDPDHRRIQAAVGHRDLPEVVWQPGLALTTF